MYILDTNTVIDFLDGNQTISHKIQEAYKHDVVKIPDVAYYEILRGFLYKDPKQQIVTFENFARGVGLIYLDYNSLRLASKIWADLRKSGVTIDDDDIFIAALALNYDAVVITNNTKHFSPISGLHLENWNK